MNQGNVASGALLVIVGVWLLLQTIAGDLPRRLLSLAGVKGASNGGGGGILDGIPLPGFPPIPGVPGLPNPLDGILS